MESDQLRGVCGQFEEVLLASLLPKSLFHASLSGEDDDRTDGSVESTQSAAIFMQALAAAIERAGGLGLGREMYRTFAQGHS